MNCWPVQQFGRVQQRDDTAQVCNVRKSIKETKEISTVGWASRRVSGLLKLSDDVLAWLSIFSKADMIYYVVHLMPLPPDHLLLH